MSYLYVAAGGVLGALARFAIGSTFGGAGGSFPWATLGINVAGSIFLGFLMAAFPGWQTHPDLRLLFTVGFCGSFTTFSTFGYEAVMLIQGGSPALAAAYIAGSIALGLGGVLLGLTLGGMVA